MALPTLSSSPCSQGRPGIASSSLPSSPGRVGPIPAHPIPPGWRLGKGQRRGCPRYPHTSPCRRWKVCAGTTGTRRFPCGNTPEKWLQARGTPLILLGPKAINHRTCSGGLPLAGEVLCKQLPPEYAHSAEATVINGSGVLFLPSCVNRAASQSSQQPPWSTDGGL